MKFRINKVLLIILAFSFSIQAQKKAFEIEDLYKVKYVGSPAISNNEELVAFTVTTSNLKEASSNTEIYLMNADGTNQKQLTNNEATDFNPIWKNDDSGILFTSTRTGSAQLFCLPIGGGESKQITDFELGISSPKLSVDGKSIIFQASVFPECGIDVECNKKIDDAMNDGPVQAHLADSLFVRHWTEYNDGKYTHTLNYNFETEEYKDLTPGFFNSPAFSAGGSDHYNYSPDSKTVAFDSKRVKNIAASTNTDVFTVSSNGENLENITFENNASDFNPVYSPDGNYIAYLTQVIPTYESDRIRLAIYDVKNKTNKIITNAFDNWVSSFEWSSDSKSIYFTGFEKGYMPLFKINIETKEIEKIIAKRVISSFTLSPQNDFVIYSHSFVHKPVELAYYKLASVRNIDLTRINKAFTDSVDVRPAEQVWVKGANGKPVHVFIVKPHDFDSNKKYPLLINVHGGPQYQWMDSFRGDWQVYPGAGYVLAFPNPHGSIGYGQKYTAAISDDWDGKVYEDVMKVTDYLADLDYVDETKMGAMGWSYGGYFMNLLQAKTDRFKCLASMMGIYDLKEFKDETEELWFANWDLKRDDYETMSPSKYEDNFKTPTLIITGEKDYRIPYTQSLRYFTVLQNKGIDSRLIVFKNDGHWPSGLRSMPLYYNSHLEWFNKYLGGEKAPWNSKELIRNLAY
ncbi:MAG: S9 family peptidase [Melioribacteraceae bacterium]|jgi:dipeptidyl aminopeptidase/acylaminoacyl peptidase|nr:S9 family peptidase [Melioribacteraceae bacterium]